MHDFIIVGAGTAGCVLAERLTASSAHRVLLIEAGTKPDSMFVRVPLGIAKLFRTNLDWNFESEPHAALDGRRVFIPRGKMLGGSANMNAQVHQWCHPADFDGWAASGAPGWAWNDVAPVFRSMEAWAGDEVDEPRRGHSGPMVISRLRTPNPLSVAFVRAAHAAGLNGTSDYNGGPFAGAWLSQVAGRNGRRYSTYDAYLKPAMLRGNLEVRAASHAIRVLLEDGRAVGVTVRRDGREETLRAARGVVLAAGAYGTPQLLLLSGLGPADHLRQHGIPVLRDVPEVGSNLQEHPLLPVMFGARRPITLKNAESPLNLLSWLLFGRGMLASNLAEAIAVTSTKGEAAPDLELCFVPAEWRDQGLEPPQVHGFGCGVVVLTPRSRGTVRLRSGDPLTAPAIDLALLSDPDGADADVLTHGVELFRRIVATEPLASECSGELAPGPLVRGRDAVLAYCGETLQTIYHPAGTCRMGTDTNAPVTPDLRFKGCDNLWVADASVMPTVPRGHPNAVVAMIAHRAADLIAA
jgi:choline dehydrogenase